MLGRENKRKFRSEENIKLLSLLCLGSLRGEKKVFYLIFLEVENKREESVVLLFYPYF